MHKPTVCLGTFGCLRVEADLRESTGIEDLGAQHPHLNVCAVIRGCVRINDTKTLRIDDDVNVGRIRFGDRAAFYGSPNFVIVSEAAEETGLENADSDCGLLSVNLLMRINRWRRRTRDCEKRHGQNQLECRGVSLGNLVSRSCRHADGTKSKTASIRIPPESASFAGWAFR